MALSGPGAPSKGTPRSRARGIFGAAPAAANDAAAADASRRKTDPRPTTEIAQLMLLPRDQIPACVRLKARAISAMVNYVNEIQSISRSQGALAACPRSRRRRGTPRRRGGAAEEKRLFIYNWTDFIGRNTIAEFEKEIRHQGDV